MERSNPWRPPGLGWTRRAITATSAVTAADRGVVIDGTSGTYDVTATAAATLGSGFSFGLYNSGTGVVTFNPTTTETIRTPSGTALTLSLTQGQGAFIQTDGANWEVVCSVGLASGFGWSRRAVTGTATVTTADNGVIIDSTNNTFAANLPAAATAGSGFIVGFYVSGPGIFTITGNGAETIQTTAGSANTLALTTGMGLILQCTGTAWESIAGAGNAANGMFLTGGRVPYAGSQGRLIDAAGFTFNGTDLATPGALAITGALSGVTTIANSGIHTNTNATASTSVDTGALTVDGGIGANGAIYGGSTINVVSAAPRLGILNNTGTADDWGIYSESDHRISFKNNTSGYGEILKLSRTGVVTAVYNTASTNTTTGSIVSAGGMGVAGAMNVGGTITVPSGIIFANETLANYDEGTWTPKIAGDGTAGTQTYSVRTGYYVRIGKMVWCDFYINMSALDGATAGNIYIGDLPFAVSSASNYISGGNIGAWGNITLTGGYTQLNLRTQAGATLAYLGQSGSASGAANIGVAGISATTDLRGTIQYEI